MEKSLVVVSRKWHEPFIRLDITEVGIGITMTLEDFVRALAVEIHLPAEVVAAAGERVVAGMKSETTKVV